MAAAEPLQNIKAEVTCPICRELFRDPVTSECGHSFCRECIARLCQGDGDVACPLCNEKLRKGNLRPNRELKNIVELVKSQAVEDPRGGYVCKTHREPLRFYCKEDETPVCLACERSWAHRTHMVVPVEKAVQEHREAIRKHLEGIESGYEKLHLIVSMGWTHLPQSAREEEHLRLKRLADNVATLLKVDTEGPRQRFAASQTQPRDPVWRGVSPGREAAGETESQGPAGTEPGSEPAAEKQEETGSHVVHVCEEAPTPKYGLDQASLDPAVHKISDTREDAEPQVDVKGQRSRFDSPTSPAPSQVSVGDQAGVSPAGQGAAQTELGGDTGREPGSEPAAEKQEETRTHVGHVCEEAPTPKYGLDQASLDPTIQDISNTREGAEPQVAVKSVVSRFLEWLFPAPSQVSAGDQAGVSPAGQGAAQTKSGGDTVEVTLDPATAHPRLVLSEDRKSVTRRSKRQQLPNNPERFNASVCVLGSEGFTSGRRYWEVEVGPREGWAIGVARDSVQRKGGIQLKPDEGIWALDSSERSQVPRKVGVYLDYERGEVRFYNAETMALISSRTATFTGRLVPFFHLRGTGSRLSLSPRQR